MYTFPVYWTDKLKIDFLQRVILIHSYLYYEKDNSVWTDKHYDEIAKQLLGLQQNKSKDWIVQNTQYGYVFYDYDGTTGFDLWDRLKQKDKQKILSIAESRKMVKQKNYMELKMIDGQLNKLKYGKRKDRNKHDY